MRWWPRCSKNARIHHRLIGPPRLFAWGQCIDCADWFSRWQGTRGRIGARSGPRWSGWSRDFFGRAGRSRVGTSWLLQTTEEGIQKASVESLPWTLSQEEHQYLTSPSALIWPFLMYIYITPKSLHNAFWIYNNHVDLIYSFVLFSNLPPYWAT